MSERRFLAAEDIKDLVMELGDNKVDRIILELIDRAADVGLVSPNEDSLYDHEVIDLIFEPAEGVYGEIENILWEFRNRAIAFNDAVSIFELTDKEREDLLQLTILYFMDQYSDIDQDWWNSSEEIKELLENSTISTCAALRFFIDVYDYND